MLIDQDLQLSSNYDHIHHSLLSGCLCQK